MNFDFDAWWKEMKPAECDELKPYFEESWQLGFKDGYEKGVAAFHEAVKIEREKYAYRDGHHAGWANATKEIRKLLADIKEWDVSTYLTLPLELRQRIQNAIGD